MTEEIDPHEFHENIIDEISYNLYKHPASAIKELVSNGLDEQSHQSLKEQRIEILTHVGPDDDIWVVDWGNGILDYDKFRVIGSGKKTTLSDPSVVIGKKGFGKVGPRSLSGSLPEPIVEWWSHTPEILNEDGSIRYYQSGMKVTLLKVGYRRVLMNSEVALDHHGCKAVIKNALYNKLPSVAKMTAYLSKIYAIRISRGTKIVLDGNVIAKPEGFDSREYDLFQLDSGEWIRGNAWRNDKVDCDNVQINVKYVLCKEYRIDNPCEIWVNDDYLTPTTSREDIVGDARLEEIREKLQGYADEHYPRPAGPKFEKMANEKQKDEKWIQLLLYRNKLLTGEYDPEGIEGEITSGQDVTKTWKRKKGIKLTNTGGGIEPPIIPIGSGTRSGGIRGGGSGPNPSIEDNGDHDILIQEGENEKEKNGRIKPKVKKMVGPFGKDQPYMKYDGVTQYWNTSWTFVQRANKASGEHYIDLIAPLYAQAMINFDKEQFEKVDAETWQKRYERYIEFVVGGGK